MTCMTYHGMAWHGMLCYVMLQNVKKETIARSFVFFGQHIICLQSNTESLHLSLMYNGIFDLQYNNTRSCPRSIPPRLSSFRRKHSHDEMSCRCAKDKLLFDTRLLLCNLRIHFPGCWQARTFDSYLSPRVCLWWCQSPQTRLSGNPYIRCRLCCIGK